MRYLLALLFLLLTGPTWAQLPGFPGTGQLGPLCPGSGALCQPTPPVAACAGTNFRLCAHAVAGAVSGTITTVTTPAIDTTGADLIVIAVSGFANGSGFCAPGAGLSDSNSNTYTALTRQDSGLHLGSAEYAQLFYKQAPTVGAGMTFTCASSVAPSIAVVAFAGSIATPFDQQNGSTFGTPTTTLNTGSVTPGNTNQLLIAAVTTGSAATYSVDSGFTISDQIAFLSGNNEGLAMAYLIETSIVAQNPTFTFTASSDASASVIATFKSQ